MARPKIPRKSTSVDMTAMCDVAFLLLSFFILTTKFKPSEAVTVSPPASVSSKIAPDKNIFLVNITHDGKVFVTIDDDKKAGLLTSLNEDRKLGLSSTDIARLSKLAFYGVPLGSLRQQPNFPQEQQNDKSLPGLSVKDSANNDMEAWIRAVKASNQGGKMDFLVKGDNASKYPAFKNIIQAFKDNDQLKFKMVTNPSGVPTGSELYKVGRGGLQPVK